MNCPNCGAENLAAAMNCVKCRINLDWAVSNLDQLPLEKHKPKLLEQKIYTAREEHELLERIRLIVWGITGILMILFIVMQSSDSQAVIQIRGCFFGMMGFFIVLGLVISVISSTRSG